LRYLRLGGVDVLVVFDDMHLGEWPGSDELDVQLRKGRGRERVTHDVIAAADIGKDVVGGAVDVPFMEGVQQRFARAVLGENVAVAHVGDRKSTRLNSSHGSISYAVLCLK